MRIGWLTCIPAVLLPHSPCRSTTANAPANRQMPIASVVRGSSRKKRKDRNFKLEVSSEWILLRKSLLHFRKNWKTTLTSKRPRILKINKETLEKTVHCKKDFDCIKNNNICCKVESCVNKEVHFVECSEKKSCYYRMTFGHSDICTCPTRKEIYNKYGR